MFKISLTENEKEDMIRWIIGEDHGLSSETIWSVIMEIPSHPCSLPYGCWDFGRCYRLLKRFNADKRKEILNAVAYEYKDWIPIIENWDKLSELYRSNKTYELNATLYNYKLINNQPTPAGSREGFSVRNEEE